MQKMLRVWLRFSKPNISTCRAFIAEKVFTISVSTGVLIRPLRILVVHKPNGQVINYKGAYVDSVCVHKSDTLRIAGVNFPDKVEKPEQYLDLGVLMIMCDAWTVEPRLSLGLQMMRQAMSTTPIKADATIDSLERSEPLVMTSFATAISATFTAESPIAFPGKSVVTAFINRSLNTKDAASVSKEWAESGTM